jgi:hypothetical protein
MAGRFIKARPPYLFRLAGGSATRQQKFFDLDHEPVKRRKPRNGSLRQMLQQRGMGSGAIRMSGM